jgi:hypothetical protein
MPLRTVSSGLEVVALELTGGEFLNTVILKELKALVPDVSVALI